MKNHSLIMILLTIGLLLLAACGPNKGDEAAPSLSIPTTAVIDPSGPVETTEIPIIEPTDAATAEPTLLETTDETLEIWSGIIERLPIGSQFDDQFRSERLEQGVCGINGSTPAVNELINQARDSGLTVSVQGFYTEDVPDVNGCQVVVVQLDYE